MPNYHDRFQNSETIFFRFRPITIEITVKVLRSTSVKRVLLPVRAIHVRPPSLSSPPNNLSDLHGNHSFGCACLGDRHARVGLLLIRNRNTVRTVRTDRMMRAGMIPQLFQHCSPCSKCRLAVH